MNRYIWGLIGVLLVQIGLLAYMAGKREYIAAKEPRVFLKAEPYDPMDPFRGEYVSIQYEIEHPRMDSRNFPDLDYSQKVYLLLKTDSTRCAHFAGVAVEEPDSGLFIKAASRCHYRRDKKVNTYDGAPHFDLHLDKYFVQQGRGIEIEKAFREKQVEIEVAIGSDGTAIIVGHRFTQPRQAETHAEE